jgi:Na+/alanine symporter
MLYFFYFAPFSKFIFLYVLICLILIAGCWTKMVGGGIRMRRGRRSTHRTVEETQQDNDIQKQVEQQAAVDVAQQDDDDA